jgi:hypothetical protein
MNFQFLNLNGIEYENGKGFKLISGQQVETTRTQPSYTVCASWLAQRPEAWCNSVSTA